VFLMKREGREVEEGGGGIGVEVSARGNALAIAAHEHCRRDDSPSSSLRRGTLPYDRYMQHAGACSGRLSRQLLLNSTGVGRPLFGS
jgi:hypothetical protein